MNFGGPEHECPGWSFPEAAGPPDPYPGVRRVWMTTSGLREFVLRWWNSWESLWLIRKEMFPRRSSSSLRISGKSSFPFIVPSWVTEVCLRPGGVSSSSQPSQSPRTEACLRQGAGLSWLLASWALFQSLFFLKARHLTSSHRTSGLKRPLESYLHSRLGWNTSTSVNR